MGYRDSDDSGFSRHGMNRDNDHHHDSLQQQRSQRAGFDHPDLNRDEDLRTSHSIPGDSRTGRHEPYGGRRDGQLYQGARSWDGRGDAGRDFGRDRYQGGDNRSQDTGYGYGTRSPDITGYDPFEAEQRLRQQHQHQHQHQQYGGDYGQGDRARLNRPDAWAHEGYGNYGGNTSHDRDRDRGSAYANRRGRSYGYGYDGRQDGDSGNYDRQQGNPPLYRSSQREHHDPDYSAWRQHQLRLLDEDYDSWRNERYQKFSDEFNTWRTSRGRTDGLLGSNQSGQVVQANASNGKAPQAGNTGITGTGITTASTAGTAASGKSSRDTS